MKKDPLQKDLQREIRKFRWKRRFLKFQIFTQQQRLKFTTVSQNEVFHVQKQIKNLLLKTHKLEQEIKEDTFYRMYLRDTT